MKANGCRIHFAATVFLNRVFPWAAGSTFMLYGVVCPKTEIPLRICLIVSAKEDLLGMLTWYDYSMYG